MRKKLKARPEIIFLGLLALIPVINAILPFQIIPTDAMRPILIFAILGLGLNIVTGSTGLLHLGVAAFMAVGSYVYAILTCDIYPFQIGFWGGAICASLAGAAVGMILGLPTLRLRGDYLAIVTLGFGEIVQDLLRNLEVITKGTQGINPLPTPYIGSFTFSSETSVAWFYLLLTILVTAVILNRNLLMSRVGRAWLAVREDELAASCMGLPTVRVKLQAFGMGAGLCGLAGALWASQLGSTGDPGNYDFQISILALCIVIVGGLGSIPGVIVGALLMIGFNSILLVKVSELISQNGISRSGLVFANPTNWKYMIFGLALILMMRFRPDGIVPAQRGVIAR